MLLINGTAVKVPAQEGGLVIDLHTIDAESTGRNAYGTMVRDVVAQKERMQLRWVALSDFEMQQILNLIHAPFFDVTYRSPREGIVTKTFYRGDTSSPVYSWNEKFEDFRWEELTVNFIER